jgi:hypothetical protein
VAGCGSTNPPPKAQVQVPSDGVHIDGAFTGVYPISSAGTCNDASTGAAIGMELIKYKGAGAYAPLDWPPYQNSAAWVGLIGGKTWRAHSGGVIVTSDLNGKISGTLTASGMQEVGGTTTVNASGSWRCQTV